MTLPTDSRKSQITIVGAGPAGTLMAILLAKRGHQMVVYERLPDLRRTPTSAGRSINLALADRGIHALKQAGVFESIEPLMIPMRGRMLHDEAGRESLLQYGSDAREVIYSISRARLTAALLDYAERLGGVDLRFRQTAISVDAQQRSICMQDIPTGRLYSLPLQRVIGADGAGSILRRYLTEARGVACREEMLTHGYKELTIAPGPQGFQLDPNALHVWPRGGFMLIALPNADCSFTATLFLPHDGPASFATLTDAQSVLAFFERHFPDALKLIPDLPRQFATHPTGSMGTVRCARWTQEEELVLMGDAAHAIVPFHGQGMNCAFEDCVELDRLLAERTWREACSEFERRRRPNTEAIADMALENYVEMRDTVRDPKFLLQKELSLELERRFPGRFVPRYSMVMFHHEIPYAAARERGAIQQRILDDLTTSADHLSEIDYGRAAALIDAQLG